MKRSKDIQNQICDIVDGIIQGFDKLNELGKNYRDLMNDVQSSISNKSALKSFSRHPNIFSDPAVNNLLTCLSLAESLRQFNFMAQFHTDEKRHRALESYTLTAYAHIKIGEKLAPDANESILKEIYKSKSLKCIFFTFSPLVDSAGLTGTMKMIVKKDGHYKINYNGCKDFKKIKSSMESYISNISNSMDTAIEERWDEIVKGLYTVCDSAEEMNIPNSLKLSC